MLTEGVVVGRVQQLLDDRPLQVQAFALIVDFLRQMGLGSDIDGFLHHPLEEFLVDVEHQGVEKVSVELPLAW